MIDLVKLAAEYETAKAEAREDGVHEAELDNVVTARLQEAASRTIAQFIDRRHWENHDAVNRAHFD